MLTLKSKKNEHKTYSPLYLHVQCYLCQLGASLNGEAQLDCTTVYTCTQAGLHLFFICCLHHWFSRLCGLFMALWWLCLSNL